MEKVKAAFLPLIPGHVFPDRRKGGLPLDRESHSAGPGGFGPSDQSRLVTPSLPTTPRRQVELSSTREASRISTASPISRRRPITSYVPESPIQLTKSNRWQFLCLCLVISRSCVSQIFPLDAKNYNFLEGRQASHLRGCRVSKRETKTRSCRVGPCIGFPVLTADVDRS